MKEIHLITHESSNLEMLYVDKELHHQGDPIPSYVWMELLKYKGYEVSYSEITDEGLEYYY